MSPRRKGQGNPINRTDWPTEKKMRDWLAYCDQIHRDNGQPSLSTLATAMNMTSRSRINKMLRGLGRPADEAQARNLLIALGAEEGEVERGLRMYRAACAEPADQNQAMRRPTPSARQAQRLQAARHEALRAATSPQAQVTPSTRLDRSRERGKSWLTALSRPAGVVVIAALVAVLTADTAPGRPSKTEALDLVYVVRPVNQKYQITIKEADGGTHKLQADGPLRFAKRVPSGWVIVSSTVDSEVSSQVEGPARIVLLSGDGMEREIATVSGIQPYIINGAGTRMLVDNYEKGRYQVYDLPGGSLLGEASTNDYLAAGFAGDAVIMRRQDGEVSAWFDFWLPNGGPFHLIPRSEKFDGIAGFMPGGRALFTKSDCLFEVDLLDSLQVLRRMCKIGDLDPRRTGIRISPDGRWLIGATSNLSADGGQRFIVTLTDDLLDRAVLAGELVAARGFEDAIFYGTDKVLFKKDNVFMTCFLDTRACEPVQLPALDGQSPSYVSDGTASFEPE